MRAVGSSQLCCRAVQLLADAPAIGLPDLSAAWSLVRGFRGGRVPSVFICGLLLQDVRSLFYLKIFQPPRS